MRINKYLAECGVASRRKSEELVLAGKVTVDGKKVTELSTDVDIENSRVTVNGKIVHPINKHIYLKMNKPKGYVCTTSDDKRYWIFCPKSIATSAFFRWADWITTQKDCLY